MSWLYVISEDDIDDCYFLGITQKISGHSFTLMPQRLRKNGGISAAKKAFYRVQTQIKWMKQKVEDCFFVMAIDNDRAPAHPEHSRIPGLPPQDQKKECRFCELEREAMRNLGPRRTEWNIGGAIAIPVQMLESWLLLSLDSSLTDDTLPIFPDGCKQLKDLFRDFYNQSGLPSKKEFIEKCIDQTNIENLQSRSASFKQFVDQIYEWNLNPNQPIDPAYRS
ncbi:MAG: hypothetical protein A2583_14505 [Bdellovibrionales bacterium RIFOXYD1_FULL_53_11]|nr:MAG: hypothetical protein A2583_14505 [Bdellovibrionales bacterium RIFOXYD1_FULL_53_11]